MHADICEAGDVAAVARFKRVLHDLGAKLIGDLSTFVQLLEVRVEGDVLLIFGDEWFVDVSGPPELVAKIVSAMREDPTPASPVPDTGSQDR